MKRHFRHIVQSAATLLSNPHIPNFFNGTINKSASKQVCVPGLNCYSCPGAAGACPIGSLQSVMGSRGQSFSFYVTGLLLLFAALLGRFICGFLCPFGLVQDLLHKIKIPKLTVPSKPDRVLRYLKYATLALVIFAPLFMTDAFGIGTPAFCKYICPAGTLQGGIPLLISNPTLRQAAGWLFSWKMLVLIAILVLSVLIYRPFCKYLCPLGAFYGLFNKLSLYHMSLDKSRCIDCGKCEKACKMGVKVTEDVNSAECIRCGDCKHVCPTGAIYSGFMPRKTETKGTNPPSIPL